MKIIVPLLLTLGILTGCTKTCIKEGVPVGSAQCKEITVPITSSCDKSYVEGKCN